MVIFEINEQNTHMFDRFFLIRFDVPCWVGSDEDIVHHPAQDRVEKIDGAVATIMGLDRAIRCGNVVTESVYDHRGILFL